MARKSRRAAAAPVADPAKTATPDSPGISEAQLEMAPGVVEASSTPGAADFEVPDDGLDDDDLGEAELSTEPAEATDGAEPSDLDGTQPEGEGDPWVFDPYAPCPSCGDWYPHMPPPGADVSGGVAYPSLVYHFARKHPDETVPPNTLKED